MNFFYKHITFFKKNIMTAFLLLTLIFTSGCSKITYEPISESGFYFNTVISVTIYDPSKEHLLEECFSLAKHYENLFSRTIADSDISKINNAKGSPVTVSDETIEILEIGLTYCELSGGKFDITIGALSDLWDFSTKALIAEEEMSEAYLPSEDAIQTALSTVDYHAVQIDGTTVTLTNPNAAIDLGGIAKGYIADKMKAFLNENGVTSGYINLGGNVLALGPKDSSQTERTYTIGVQKPFDESGNAICAVKITDETVVSSGVYERYFVVDDTRYHHLLDTSTGYPISNDLLGVTIITTSSVDGDALSTTCFALGLEDGLALIESLPDTEAIFITSDYKMHNSSGIGTSIPCRSY